MRRITLSLLLLTVVLILSGCFGSPPDSSRDDTGGEPQVATSKSVVEKDEPVVKKFYPNVPIAQRGESTVTSDLQAPLSRSDDFIVTQELMVKIYLVDKYNNGVCYGQPIAVTQSTIASLIGNDPGLTAFIRGKYQLTSDLDVYNKIKQLNGIKLDKRSGGSYVYSFTDGQCCVLKAYQGNISIVGQTITDIVKRQETKQNPC